MLSLCRYDKKGRSYHPTCNVAVLSIAGCTSNSNQATPTATPTSTPTPTPKPTPKPTPPHLTVLFFYEPNCPYCEALQPNVTKLETTYAGKVPVERVQSYTNELTDQYNVTTSPTLILLNNGHEVGRWVGVTSTTGISAKISSLLRAS